MMDMNVMMDCECDAGWNVEENGYECYDGLSIWVRLGLIYLIWILMLRMDRLGLIVYLIWILMLRMDMNVMNLIKVGFYF